jgi:hypothetical protein
MSTKQYDKTIPELKLLMTKAKEAGRPDVAAGIAKIMIQQDAEIKQEAAATEKKAGEREAFVEHTPSFTPMDTIRDNLYTGVQGEVDTMVGKVKDIEAERQAVPPVGRRSLIEDAMISPFLPEGGGTAPKSEIEAGLYMAGEAVAPALGGAALEYGKAGLSVLGNLTPDEIEKPTVEALKGLVFDVAESDAWEGFSEAMSKGWEATVDFMDMNPNQKRKLESVVNVAAFKGKVPPSTVVALKGKNLSIWGAQGKRSKRDEGIFKAMLPTQKEMRTSDRGTSTTSKGGVVTWTPSKIETERLLELKKVPTFDPKAPYGYNVDQVLEHINKLSDRVVENIYANGNPPIKRGLTADILDANIDTLVESKGWKAMNGAMGQVTPLVEHLKDLVMKSDGTTAGLLQVRKDFDKWLKTYKPADIEQGLQNSRTKIVSLARKVLNEEVQKAIPDAASQSLLKRQSLLYQNLDVLGPKADVEILGVFGKIQHYVRDKTGITVPKTPASIAGNTLLATGLATTPWFPSIAGAAAVAGAGLVTANALRSPKIRSFAGASLTALSKVMAKTTDPIKLNLMKADRAVLVHYLNQPAIEEEPVLGPVQ